MSIEVNSASKPKVLLVWGYHRKNWVYPFEKLNSTFNFVFLHHLSLEDEQGSLTNSRKIYWSDFKSARDLLEQEKPRLVIFMSIDSPLTMALNSWCKRLNISTAVLQHGLFHNFDFYKSLFANYAGFKAKVRPNASQEQEDKARNFIKKFFVKSTTWWNLDMFFTQVKIQRLKREGLIDIDVHSKTKSRWKIANKYFTFTRQGTNFWTARDGVPEDKIHPVGSFEIDDFANIEAEKYKEKNYFLLIDNGFGESKEHGSTGFGMNISQVVDFYGKLDQFSKSHNCTLKVKLHPASYKSEFYKTVKDVEFIKDAEMKELILESKGVFCFFSSLTIPAILYKKVILFDLGHNNFMQTKAKELKVAQLISMDFNVSDLSFDFQKSEKGLEEFKNLFVLSADGKNIHRLNEAILNLSI